MRFLLSDIASINTATPFGPYPSYDISSKFPESLSPDPLAIALSIVSLGIFAPKALSKANLNLGLSATSEPPSFEATVSSLINLEKIFCFFSSCRPFLCFIFAHLEWPAIYSFSSNVDLIAKSSNSSSETLSGASVIKHIAD